MTWRGWPMRREGDVDVRKAEASRMGPRFPHHRQLGGRHRRGRGIRKKSRCDCLGPDCHHRCPPSASRHAKVIRCDLGYRTVFRHCDHAPPSSPVQLFRLSHPDHTAQTGFLLSKNARIPSGASSPSHRLVNALTVSSTVTSSITGPNRLASALASATAPGAALR